MTEVWKDIQGYEGLYHVSNLGNVRNIKIDRVLKPIKNKWGYLQVKLCKDCKLKNYSIHRLVAEAFIPNPYNLPCVNHKDEVKTNNCITNLEWCTHEYNTNYGTRNERIAKTKINGKKSKTVLQLRMDGSLVRIWPSVSEVERQLGYSPGNISKCCIGEYHTAYNYKWCYAKQ